LYLAQVNVATLKFPIDSPQLKDFADNLDPVNVIAESSEGFIWRLKDDTGNATEIQAFDDPNIIFNMSVWRSVEDLKNFMFRTHHLGFMKRKKEWFEPMTTDNYVLWWIKPDEIPTVEQGRERLLHLREHGDTPHAFTFKSNFKASEI
jgi:hypothetical protein